MFQPLSVIYYWSAISIFGSDLLTFYSHLIWLSTSIQKLAVIDTLYTLWLPDVMNTFSASWIPLICNSPIIFLIHCHLNLTKQVTNSKSRVFREMRSFDIDKFCADLSNSELLTSTPVDDLHVLVLLLQLPFIHYLTGFVLLLFTSQALRLRSRVPWLTEEMRSAKKLRKKLERT